MKKYRSVIGAWIGWIIARILLVSMCRLDTGADGDVIYYFTGIYGSRAKDMTEYPDVGAWPTLVVSWFSGQDLSSYINYYIVMCLLVDGAFLALLLRRHAHNRRAILAAWFWIIFGTAAGPVLLMRLDLFPALAVAGAGAFFISRPNVAAGLLALATTMKLWPGVLAVALVDRVTRAHTWVRLMVFVATGAALSAVTVLTQGVDRLLSPLNYQGERGLQIESLPASIAIVQAHLNPRQYSIFYASSKSFEITGPGVDTAIAISTVSMAVLLFFAVSFALYRFCAGGWTTHSAQALCVLLVLALIATNKVFSPQYIVWIGPLLAVLVRQSSRRGVAWLKGFLALCAIIAAGLGTYIFPFNYASITDPGFGLNAAVICLVVRNSLILVMTLGALAWFIAELRLGARPRIVPQGARLQRLGA